MSEIADRYGRVGDGFGARLSGVTPEQWDHPTPCTDWNVRDLVVHVISTHRRVVANLDGAEVAELDPDDDLGARWAEATAAVRSALADPDRARRTVSGMFGEQSFESLVGRLLCADTLFHTWDLARATGQDERLDQQAAGKALEFLAPLDEAIRRPGGFAPKIDSSDGADPQTRLLNFGGRSVR
ncbi:MAG: TIGR03086 family metal-binding protein [Acidimicrobiales bacterium]